MAKLKNYFADSKREVLFTLFFLSAMLLFPWLAFMLVRLIATFFQIQPNSLTGNLMSAFPNLIIALLAIAFLKVDDWDFSTIGISFRKVLPGLLFAILTLAGLYTILPLGMSIFFEPRTLLLSFQGFNALYLVLFIRGWFIVGISEELASRGFLLNKSFSLLPKAINPTWKKIWAVLFTMLFFSLINYIRLRTAGNIIISTNTMITYFVYGLLVSYLYLRTNNLFVAGFMQSAFIFPPLGLTVGKEFALSDPGFIVSFLIFVLFIILLAESYVFWGKPLEFEKKTNPDLEMEPIDETKASEASAD